MDEFRVPLDVPAFTTTTTEEQGSFALTKEGPVLGCPRGIKPELQALAKDRIRQWMDSGGILVLPFPVWVQDARI